MINFNLKSQDNKKNTKNTYSTRINENSLDITNVLFFLQKKIDQFKIAALLKYKQTKSQSRI